MAVMLTLILVLGAFIGWCVLQDHKRFQSHLNEHNLRLVGLGTYVFAETFETFPPSEGFNRAMAELPIEKRLSWLAAVLSFVGQPEAPFVEFEYEEAWDGPKNRLATGLTVDFFQNPALPGFGPTNGTHYVGIAGIGADAAKLPSDDPKAGVLGYGRSTPIDGIPDGATRTLLMLSISAKAGPWGQAGPSTLRGLSQQPYVGGPDGFGSERPGVYALMADGTARFIDKDVDPKVLEAMATKAGNEAFVKP